jgi:hypothetical protein
MELGELHAGERLKPLTQPGNSRLNVLPAGGSIRADQGPEVHLGRLPIA